MRSVAFTGHRPPKLNGYNKARNQKLLCALEIAILNHINKGFNTFITGMALGVDMWAGQIVTDLRDFHGYTHIKLIAAVPFKGQESVCPPSSREGWSLLIKLADEVHVLKNSFSSSALQERNIWMVDHADALIAVWDGSSGGTGNCMKYVMEKGKPFYQINPVDFK